MTRHRAALRHLATRGDPRGADRVLHAARAVEATSIAGDPSPGNREVAVGLARPSPPPRARLAVAAFLVVVLVGGVVVWALRPGGPDTTGPGPIETTLAPTSTTAPTEPPMTPEALGLVPRHEWPDPALEPVLRLAPCPEVAGLSAFMAAEFPEAADHAFQPVDAGEMATLIPMPRVGHLSLFAWEDLDGACLGAGRREEIVGWWLEGEGGTVIARAAARDVGVGEIPVEASQGPYHQSWTASMHNFTGRVYLDGRAQVVVGPYPGRYTVLEVPNRVPADGGDHLAASLAARPFDVGRLSNVSLLPTLLPSGYGPCVGQPFFLGSGSHDLNVYCTADGDHIEIHGPESVGARPRVPGDAEPAPVGIAEGRTWEAGGRRFVVVELARSRAPGLPLTVWASGPSHLHPDTFGAILSSTVALRPDTLVPRRGGGDLRDIVNDVWLRRVVAAAASTAVDPPEGAGSGDPLVAQARFRLGDDVEAAVYTLLGTDPAEWLPGDFAGWAILARGTDVVGVGGVDVLERERDNGVEMNFTCGRVTFGVSFDDSSERPLVHDPDWSRNPDRRSRILGFLHRLVAEIGCEA